MRWVSCACSLPVQQATAMSSTALFIANLFVPDRFVDPILDAAADVQLIQFGAYHRMYAVGKEDINQLLLWVYPYAGTRIARMAECSRRCELGRVCFARV